jgi:hypothetical protein
MPERLYLQLARFVSDASQAVDPTTTTEQIASAQVITPRMTAFTLTNYAKLPKERSDELERILVRTVPSMDAMPPSAYYCASLDVLTTEVQILIWRYFTMHPPETEQVVGRGRQRRTLMEE